MTLCPDYSIIKYLNVSCLNDNGTAVRLLLKGCRCGSYFVPVPSLKVDTPRLRLDKAGVQTTWFTILSQKSAGGTRSAIQYSKAHSFSLL